jgi:hypothetical protein
MDIILNIMLSVETLARQLNPLLIRSLDQSYPLVISKHECIIAVEHLHFCYHTYGPPNLATKSPPIIS